jgi:hypothetical protein
MSKSRVEYAKVEYGERLTDWLIANSPDDLAELAELLDGLLPSTEASRTA